MPYRGSTANENKIITMRHVRQLCILIFTHIHAAMRAFIPIFCIISLYVQAAKLHSRALFRSLSLPLLLFLSMSFTQSARRFLPSYIINVKLLFDCRIWKYVSELHDRLYGNEWAPIIYHNQIKCDGVCFSRCSFPLNLFLT